MSNAKNIKVKEDTVNINGKDYVIRFTMNSFVILEEEFGSIDEALDAMKGIPVFDKEGNPVMETIKDPETGEEKKEQKTRMSIKTIRKFLWSGLVSGQPEITEDEVGNIIDLSNMNEIVKKLTETLTTSLPEVEKGDNQKN
jgi:hypothetical protein